jgi:hypothetical protein
MNFSAKYKLLYITKNEDAMKTIVKVRQVPRNGLFILQSLPPNDWITDTIKVKPKNIKWKMNII